MTKLQLYMVVMPVSMAILYVGFPQPASAQVAFLEVIKAGVKKVIKAVDLKVQRLQNETIWLQNAQKVLENQLSKLKLTEIAEWTSRQRELYSEYYTSLWKVKSAIAFYKRIRELSSKQSAIVQQYKWAWSLFKQDEHFSAAELEYMEKVYMGILDHSVKNLDQILLVLSSFKTQMSDAARLELIIKAAEQMDENYANLMQFNSMNIQTSLSRAKSESEIRDLKTIYGLRD